MARVIALTQAVGLSLKDFNLISSIAEHWSSAKKSAHTLSLQVPLVLSGVHKSFAALLAQKKTWTF